MSFRFKRPVYAGEELTCVWTIVRIDDQYRAKADVIVKNSAGQAVLLAETTGMIPNEANRVVLASTICD
jgi:acyl dehydratase